MPNAGWMHEPLVQRLRRAWQRQNPQDGGARTNAIARCFVETLGDRGLRKSRPDAMWTALQNVYYSAQAGPFLEDFRQGRSEVTPIINRLNSIRNGWVRSSGVALERAYSEIYRDALANGDPKLYLVEKSGMPHQPVARTAVNLGVDDIGQAREDDLYLLLVDPQGRAHVFGVVQVKASMGDRADQGGPRSREMMGKGYFSAVFTLDPIEVSRSPRGMLVHPAYIRTINGSAGHQNTWHYVYVGRNRNHHRPNTGNRPSRIKEVNLRNQPDFFVADAIRAAGEWLAAGHSIPIAWT